MDSKGLVGEWILEGHLLARNLNQSFLFTKLVSKLEFKGGMRYHGTPLGWHFKEGEKLASVLVPS